MIALFIFGVLLIVLVVFAVLFWFISKLFLQLSGWGRLAARYGCTPAEDVWTFRRESAKVGAVRYRRIVKAGLRPEGLFLGLGFLWHKPVCIPWSDLGEFHPDSFYQRPCMSMSAGKPPLTTLLVSTNLYREMYPYLRATAGTAS